MAVEVYGLTASALYAYLPFDTSDIGVDSKVTPDDIEDFLEKGAAGFTTAFKTQGVSYESLEDNIQADVQRGIINYVVYQALAKLGYSASRLDAYQREYRDALDAVHKSSAVVGNGSVTVLSNIDTVDVPARVFTRNKGW